jgi:diguanylate cyclase (GGDEF)-like protein
MFRAHDWLRLRLIGLVVGILLAGFAATSFISYRNASEIVKTAVLHRELPLTGDNIYSEIQVDLIRPVFISSVMANDTFVKDWLLAGETNRDQVVRYLQSIHDKYGVFTSFLVSDRTHQYYHFRNTRRPVDPNNAEDIWYFRVRDMQAPYEINIDYDLAANRTLTIFVNYRVLDYQGHFLGVTGVGLAIQSVERIVQRYRNDFQRSVYFVTKAGDVTITSSGGPPSGGNIRKLAGLRSIGDQILAHQEGQFEYSRGGETYLLDARFIPELGWYAVVEQRESDLLEGLWHSFLTNLAIGCVIIVVTAGVIVLTIAQYHRRFEQLTSTDRLTGLASLPVFEASLQHALRRGDSLPLAVLLLELDQPRSHLAQGAPPDRVDDAVQTVADCVRSQLRGDDLACRWGSEVVAVLALGCASAQAAVRAERLRRTVAGLVPWQPDDGRRITVSIGVTDAGAGDDSDAVLARVRAAVRQARAAGGNRVAVVAAGAAADAPDLSVPAAAG